MRVRLKTRPACNPIDEGPGASMPRRSPGGPAGIIPSPWPGSFHGGLPWKARLPYPFPATTTLSEDFGCFRLLPRSSCYSYVLCVCIPITNSSCTACCMLLPDVTSINSNASSGTFFLYASQSCKKILMLLSYIYIYCWWKLNFWVFIIFLTTSSSVQN